MKGKTGKQMRDERRQHALLIYLNGARRTFEREGKRDIGIHIENGRNVHHLADLCRAGHVEEVLYNGRKAHRITPSGVLEVEEQKP